MLYGIPRVLSGWNHVRMPIVILILDKRRAMFGNRRCHESPTMLLKFAGINIVSSRSIDRE